MAQNCPDIVPDLPEGCADLAWFETNIYDALDAIVDKINVHLTAEGVTNLSYLTRPSEGDCASKNEMDRISTFLDTLFATGRLPKYAWDAGNPGNPFPDPVNAADVQKWVDCDAYWTDLAEVRACIQNGANTILPEADCLSLDPANLYHKILQCLAAGSCYPGCQCPECVSDQNCWLLEECYNATNQLLVSDDLTVQYNNGVNSKVIKYFGKCWEINGPSSCTGSEVSMADTGGFVEFDDCIDCFGCWLLEECYEPTNRIYVTDDLKVQFAAGTIIEYDDDGDGNTTCWEISAPWQCTGSEITMGVWIEHPDCDTCLGNLVAEECNTVWRYRDPYNNMGPGSKAYVPPLNEQVGIQSAKAYVPPLHDQGNYKFVYEYVPATSTQSESLVYEYLPATNPHVDPPSYRYEPVDWTQDHIQSYRYEPVTDRSTSYKVSYRYEPVASRNTSYKVSYRYEPVQRIS